MKQFYTVVLDRFKDVIENYETEPYEVGWANEAMFFVRIHKLSAKAIVNARVQISYDGIVWIDEGTSFSPMNAAGDYFARVTHFGGWLRLALEVNKGESLNTTLSLVLKG